MSEQLQQEFTQEDRDLLKRLLHRPLILPPEFKSWLYKFASSDAAPHFQEILGVRARRWLIADPVMTFQACTSISYVDLATVGPRLTGIPNGHYMVMFGFYTRTGAVGVQRYGAAFYNVAPATRDVVTPLATIIRNCTGSPNSTTLTGLAQTNDLAVGMDVTGPNNTNGEAMIRPGTTIGAINSGSQITLSQPTYNVTFWQSGKTPGTADLTFTSVDLPPPTGDFSPECVIQGEGQAVMFDTVDLDKGDNSITLRHRVSNGSGDFGARWLHAVQIA